MQAGSQLSSDHLVHFISMTFINKKKLRIGKNTPFLTQPEDSIHKVQLLV
jgi:hypothetical protein